MTYDVTLIGAPGRIGPTDRHKRVKTGQGRDKALEYALRSEGLTEEDIDGASVLPVPMPLPDGTEPGRDD